MAFYLVTSSSTRRAKTALFSLLRNNAILSKIVSDVLSSAVRFFILSHEFYVQYRSEAWGAVKCAIITSNVPQVFGALLSIVLSFNDVFLLSRALR